MINYPKTLQEFINWCSSDEKYNSIYLSMNKKNRANCLFFEALDLSKFINKKMFHIILIRNLYHWMSTNSIPYKNHVLKLVI